MNRSIITLALTCGLAGSPAMSAAFAENTAQVDEQAPIKGFNKP